MYIYKSFGVKGILSFSGGHIAWLTLWMTPVAALHYFTDGSVFYVSWIPVSVIGTAVAFYVGFKNNQSYDRMWEARKIWGAIVNSSREWGTAVKGYSIGGFEGKEPLSNQELEEIKTRLIHRHIAWMYQLRLNLLVPTEWEHINQGFHVARTTENRMKRFGLGLIKDRDHEDVIQRCISKEEQAIMAEKKNKATFLVDRQGEDLKTLYEAGVIDSFRHTSLQKILGDLYIHQGKCERIKKFPFPRQYANMSSIFVSIFIFLLPFGLLPQFAEMGSYGIWIAIPILVVVSWIYMMMELIGDYSENPFEGLGNDIPMLSLCRTIEIDLRQMLDEKEIPPGIEANNGVLM
ncbi:MAG: hypothetical protein MK081_11985 [Flavobacteriales bacterium]|nr:hypothetical protein [Flavobacteriales bacterium]